MCKERIFKQFSRDGFFHVHNYDFFFHQWQDMKSRKESFYSVSAIQRPPFKWKVRNFDIKNVKISLTVLELWYFCDTPFFVDYVKKSFYSFFALNRPPLKSNVKTSDTDAESSWFVGPKGEWWGLRSWSTIYLNFHTCACGTVELWNCGSVNFSIPLYVTLSSIFDHEHEVRKRS